MALKPKIRPLLGALACFGLLLALAGCEDATKKPVQAHVPAPAPVQAPASAAPEIGALPLRNLVSQPLINLQAPLPGGIDYLIEKVKEKFSSGEANYQAGHLEAARRDFDDAVDWMLESGYDPNSDPRLSELFHQVTDTIYTYELVSPLSVCRRAAAPGLGFIDDVVVNERRGVNDRGDGCIVRLVAIVDPDGKYRIERGRKI